MVTKTVPIASLIEDFEIYPRHDVDSTHISDLARAIRAGNELPLPLVDEKSLRIIDGFHRVRAWRKVHGNDGSIKVETKRYKTEAELIKDAVSLNAAHGRKFDQQDRTRCVLMLQKIGESEKNIALTLNTTQERVKELLVRVVIVSGEREPVKPVAWPTNESPRKFTPSQLEVAKSSSGWRPQQTVTQLTKEIKAKVIDLTNEALIEKLWELHDVIEEVVPERKEK